MIIHSSDPILEIHDLTVSYDRRPVLWGVDLTLPKGALVGIIGPNGAGKSTLLKTAMGLIPASSGYVKVLGQTLDQARSEISYVPQRESVDWDFPASALDVVLMGRYGKVGLFHKLRQSDKAVALECLRKVKLEGFAHRQISQLSGGQQQRVFIARALAQDAQLYCMDEPFAGVDMATEVAIVEILRELTRKGKTVVVVHHDLQSVSKYFDWTILLNVRLIASGPTAQVFTSELLQETYGSKLTVLSNVSELIEKGGYPAREKNK
jgi:manganese/zinc/iron transport system ATP- binding protein